MEEKKTSRKNIIILGMKGARSSLSAFFSVKLINEND